MRAGIQPALHKDPKRPRQAIVVMPQWNADGVQPQLAVHDLQQDGHFGATALEALPRYSAASAELERSDYAVSANIGRTLSACRQAVVDIRCCLDWLEEQGYEHFGVLGTSLGSCYAYLGQCARCAAEHECV
jgi:dienelactone hydrolase